jgi:MFS family permease
VAFFSVAGMALGTAADRLSRTRVVAGGLLLWSLATAGSGLAQGFGHLAVARMLVGFGEATLVPAAVSLLADAIPPARLGLAAAVFTSGTPVGQALGYAVAGLLAPHVGWRGCFSLLGALGLPFAVLLLTLQEPPRRGAAHVASPPRPGEIFGNLARTLVALPSAGLIVLGVVPLAFATGAVLHTLTWLVHERGYAQPRAAALTALVTAVAGTLGNVGVGALADRWERRAAGGRAWMLAALAPFVALTSAALYAAEPGTPVFHTLWVLSVAGVLGWPGAVLAAYERLVPPRIRATAIAFAILCLNLLGLGPGALVTGWLGDTRSLTYGLMTSAAVALLATPPFLLAALRYAADREKATRLADSAVFG